LYSSSSSSPSLSVYLSIALIKNKDCPLLAIFMAKVIQKISYSIFFLSFLILLNQFPTMQEGINHFQPCDVVTQIFLK